MSKSLLSLCLTLTVFEALSQTCVHSNLSRSLLFKTEVIRIKRTEQAKESGGYADSCIIKITVLNKATHKLAATSTYFTNFLYTPAFRKCNASRSYTTGIRQDAVVWDSDYGDFIVADFNFDGKEDFATKVDDANSGPSYNYYLQTSAGSFVLDKFLTEHMGHFPDRIEKSTRTLVRESDNGKWHFKTSYRLNIKTGQWRETKHNFNHTR